MFYNTTHEIGARLKQYQDITNNQERTIMWFFLLHQGSWTPNEVLNYAFGNKIPITSVRRAMTDLTNDGKLIKTKFKRLGSFGRMVYTWTLPDGDI